MEIWQFLQTVGGIAFLQAVTTLISAIAGYIVWRYHRGDGNPPYPPTPPKSP